MRTGPAPAALLLAGLAALTVLHAVGWVRLARRAAGRRRWRRLGLALAGTATAGLAIASPLDGLAHRSFAAHMLQHVLLMMVAAPLWLLADPFSTLLWGLPGPLRRGAGRLLVPSAPLRRAGALLVAMPAAWLVQAAFLWGWHVPALYDRAVGHPAVHAAQHLTLLGSALLFWWPVVAPAPRLRRRAHRGARVGYLVLNAFQGAALGLLLALSPRVLYASYAARPDALEDQALGGVVMWALGGAVDMLAALGLLGRLLAAEEARGDRAIDPSRPVRDNEPV